MIGTVRGGRGDQPRDPRGAALARTRPLAVLLAAGLVIAATYGLSGRGRGDGDPSTPTASSRPAGARQPVGASGTLEPPRYARDELARLILAYEDRISRHTTPSDHRILGGLYLERSRISGDVADLGRAKTALGTALELFPSDLDSSALLARVRYSSHDFQGALSLAKDVIDRSPFRLDALAVLGDASLALGDTTGAGLAYGDLSSVVPKAPEVLVRRARLAFLLGHATAAARLAARAEQGARRQGASGTDIAFYLTFRGQLAFDSGRYAEAAAHHGAALDAAPGWYVAQGQLARSLAALGRHERAIRLYGRSIASVPDPTFLAALGDLHRMAGRERAAADLYATVEAVARLSADSRQVYNRTYSLFLADHGLRPALAVRLAEAELEIRRDVHGWDAYAWALFAAGRHEEAREASDNALAPGTPDAAIWYHAGMISAALGDHERADAELRKALSLSPRFDPVQAERARATLGPFGAAEP